MTEIDTAPHTTPTRLEGEPVCASVAIDRHLVVTATAIVFIRWPHLSDSISPYHPPTERCVGRASRRARWSLDADRRAATTARAACGRVVVASALDGGDHTRRQRRVGHRAVCRQHGGHRIHLQATEEARRRRAHGDVDAGDVRHHLHDRPGGCPRCRSRRHGRRSNVCRRSHRRAARHCPDRCAVDLVAVADGPRPRRTHRRTGHRSVAPHQTRYE